MSEDLKQKFKEKRMSAMPYIGKSISDFCIDNEIENVVFIDRSARPAYKVFKEYRDKNKDSKRPNIYFISPKMLENTGVSDDEVNLFKKEHSYLANNRKPTLLFDVCIKDGLTMQNVSELFKQSGFDSVYTMVSAAHKERESVISPDKILFDDHKLGCHLFGAFYNDELGVMRDESSLISKGAYSINRDNLQKNRSDLKNSLMKYSP